MDNKDMLAAAVAASEDDPFGKIVSVRRMNPIQLNLFLDGKTMAQALNDILQDLYDNPTKEDTDGSTNRND